jgi:membrane-associated phospholipid phosphatase
MGASRRSRWALLVALLFALAAGRPARAAWDEPAPGDALGVRPAVDGAITAAGLALWFGSDLAKSRLAPSSCRVCNGADTSGLPGDPANGEGSLDAPDAALHDALTGALWSRKASDRISNVLLFGVVPAGAVAAAWLATGDSKGEGSGARAALIVAESLSVASVAIQATKFLVSRKRPFVRYGHATAGSTAAEGGTYDADDPDSHLSFPSGHTGATAALTFSAAMVASLQGSAAAPWLWAGAGVLTASVGALRMMAEKHYLTDVCAGAAIGAASGLLVPLLHRRGRWLDGSAAPAVSVSPGGASGLRGPALALAWRF